MWQQVARRNILSSRACQVYFRSIFLILGRQEAAKDKLSDAAGFDSSRKRVLSCCFCQLSHGAAAAEHLGGNYELIDRIKQNFGTAEISEKLRALLAIAGKVQKGGKHVTGEDVERARQQGATDKEIHDTVLIAAAFCMFNRYVDGLGTWQPRDPDIYREIGKQTASLGYARRDWKKPLEAATTK